MLNLLKKPKILFLDESTNALSNNIKNELINNLRTPTAERILIIKKAMELGKDDVYIHKATNIDLWFIV